MDCLGWRHMVQSTASHPGQCVCPWKAGKVILSQSKAPASPGLHAKAHGQEGASQVCEILLSLCSACFQLWLGLGLSESDGVCVTLKGSFPSSSAVSAGPQHPQVKDTPPCGGLLTLRTTSPGEKEANLSAHCSCLLFLDSQLSFDPKDNDISMVQLFTVCGAWSMLGCYFADASWAAALDSNPKVSQEHQIPPPARSTMHPQYEIPTVPDAWTGWGQGGDE